MSNKYTREDAMGNFFFLCPQKDFMFLSISKNGCTSLKHVLYEEEYGQPFEAQGRSGIHDFWGFWERPGRIVNRSNHATLSQYSNYRRFAVYRDPVDRFVSTYYNKVLHAPKPHMFYHGHNLIDISLDEFIEAAGEILQVENPLHIDEHLRPQSDYYTKVEVDDIVPLERLGQYMALELGCKSLTRRNKTIVEKDAPDREQIKKIQQLYAADYQIVPTYS